METPETWTIRNHNAPQLLTLLQVLSNPLILHHTVQYLSISSLLALGATSKPLQGIVHHTPNIFRYLDLSTVKSVHFSISQIDPGGEVWRNVQLDENVTEDDFYGGPLRGAFGELRRQHILENVQTLVLDGLSVTSELLTEIILDDSFNVRLLSVREVQNLNERKLMQALVYSVRSSRPSHKPRVKGLYIFGKKDAHGTLRVRRDANSNKTTQPARTILSRGGVTASQGAQLGAQINQRSRDALSASLQRDGAELYGKPGVLFPKTPMCEWARTLGICRGLISFDGILCSGLRHGDDVLLGCTDDELPQKPWYLKPLAYLPPAVAMVALQGCSSCGSAPEGVTEYGIAPLQALPLLAPPPFHSSTIKAGTRSNMTINGKKARLLHRCRGCLRGRYCESCHKWWCENCYELTVGDEAREPQHAMMSGPTQTSHTSGSGPSNYKVYMGLCIEDCLVGEMMSGAGSNGMWG